MSLVLWLFSIALSANLATNKFSEVAAGIDGFLATQKGKPTSVVIAFDYDDTLLSPSTVLGSEGWFNWQEEMVLKDEKNPERMATSFEDLLTLQNRFLGLVRMRPTEPMIPDYVRSLQQKGYQVIVCTSRGPAEMTSTVRELRVNGIDLSDSVFAKMNEKYEPYFPYNMDHLGGAGLNQDDVKKLGLKKPNTISFASGILFTEGQHKGAMLRTLFFKSRIPVSAAVFIDNRKKHTQKVAAAFEGRSTKMFTVHYFYKDIDTKPLTAFPDIISRSKAEWAMIKRFIE